MSAFVKRSYQDMNGREEMLNNPQRKLIWAWFMINLTSQRYHCTTDSKITPLILPPPSTYILCMLDHFWSVKLHASCKKTPHKCTTNRLKSLVLNWKKCCQRQSNSSTCSLVSRVLLKFWGETLRMGLLYLKQDKRRTSFESNCSQWQ